MSNNISVVLYTDLNGKQYSNVYGEITYSGTCIDNASGISTDHNGVVSSTNMANLNGLAKMWASKASHDANDPPLTTYFYNISGASPYTVANLYNYVIAYLQSLTTTFVGVTQAA